MFRDNNEPLGPTTRMLILLEIQMPPAMPRSPLVQQRP